MCKTESECNVRDGGIYKDHNLTSHAPLMITVGWVWKT